ncbi:MAG: caspase family protein [Bacteroidales bacterium]
MKSLPIFVLAFIFLSHLGYSQEKRALVIGIDTYLPPAEFVPNETGRSRFGDLGGSKNDAILMKSLIESRFEFRQKNIDTLYNTSATRENILKKINDLLMSSNKGDVAFLYYAGHGSQIKNSYSKEADKKDESIVPCDTWKAGVADIRDKELAAIYNKFIDKGIKFTVIMDCCHSGSGSRGIPEYGKFRFIAEPNYDVKDNSQPIPPETRPGDLFLLFAAAQADEMAQEQIDDNQIPHGAFTLAFMQALTQQSVNVSAINLFSSISEILKHNGKSQKPVLAGSAKRQSQTLFGLDKGVIADKTMVAVSGKKNEKVQLQGGFVVGLKEGNELEKIIDNISVVKLRVDKVLGPGKSEATVIAGDINNINSGDLVEITNWVSSGAPLIKIHIPTTNFTYEQVMGFAKINNELKKSDKIKWINDLENADPFTTLYFKKNKAYMNSDGKSIKELKIISVASFLEASTKDSTFYFEMPPTQGLADKLTEKLTANKSFKLVGDASNADYVLYGTVNDQGVLAYGLRRSQTTASDSLGSMPLQTEYYACTDNNKSIDQLVDSIFEITLKLSKLKGWLQLAPPTGKNRFSFHLELVNMSDNKTNKTGICKLGDEVSVHIVADNEAGKTVISPRYIYVFALDKNGKMTLGFPNVSDGNVANKFPQRIDGELIRDIGLFGYIVTEPVGTDNLFLLATEEPFANYAQLFNQEGVRRSETRGGDTNPLSELFNMGNAPAMRGGFDKIKTPANWSIYRLSVKSSH